MTTNGINRDLPTSPAATANLRTKILDFRGFDSSRILILRGGTLMSIGNFPESLSQAILVERFLIGRFGVGRWGGADGSQASGFFATLHAGMFMPTWWMAAQLDAHL